MATITVTNPASGAVVGEVPDATADDVAKVVDRARQAQPAWEALGVEDRVRVLRAVRRAFVRRRAELREVLVAESGKPWEDAQAGLVLTLAMLTHWERDAADAVADTPLDAGGLWGLGRRAKEVHRPHGVVGVIGPWNFPVALTFGDAVAALAAGNTVVLKPSEVTPLSTVWVGEMFAEVARAAGAPDDVVQVVTGTGPAGAALVDSVDMVQFTGSVRTGQVIAHACVDRNVPYSLELGGKDPWIVCEDADIPRAALAAAHYGLYNGGQVCMSAERIYVADAVHDEFVEALVEAVARLRTTPASGPGSADIAPLIDPRQGTIVADHIRDALDKGATAHTGGLPTDPVRPAPTVLTDVDHSMACMTEETFGPTLPVMRVHDEEQAIRLANDSAFGLTASVWTRDVARGEAIARRLRVGTANVNDSQMHAAMADLPMGGVGASGTGARNGLRGIRKYQQSTVVVTNRSPLTRELTWMPYRATVSKTMDALIGLLYRR